MMHSAPFHHFPQHSATFRLSQDPVWYYFTLFSQVAYIYKYFYQINVWHNHSTQTKYILIISKTENRHERPTKLFLFYYVSSFDKRLFIVSWPCILGEQLLIWGMKQWLENEAMVVWNCSYREWQCGQKINEFRWIHFT